MEGKSEEILTTPEVTELYIFQVAVVTNRNENAEADGDERENDGGLPVAAEEAEETPSLPPKKVVIYISDFFFQT